jgi:serine O-acetyltransferase
VPRIGNNVFIGVGAKILGPVTVGDGAVIGANAVVTHDVPSRCLAAGIPAKVIKTNIDSAVYFDNAPSSAD